MNHAHIMPAKAQIYTAALPGDIAGTAKMHMRKIGDVDVCVATLETALLKIHAAVEAKRASIWGFCNAHTVNMARSDPRFRSVLKQMTLFNDGVGLDIASQLLYASRFIDNLNGTDLLPELLQRLPAGTRIYLLGSAPGVAQRAAEVMRSRYPNIEIAGSHHGFFSAGEDDAIVQQIAATDVDLVLVGMGHPMQELWSAQATARLAMPLLCVGAFLDFTAGKVSRAPRVIRKLRLEWAYRLACEPRRLAKRYLWGNLTFLYAILCQRFEQSADQTECR
jgi:exopolysaccharide biosynthesis WecB/TagA/CpsF family protein